MLNDVLGEKNAAAIARVDGILKHVEGGGRNRPTFTTPTNPNIPTKTVIDDDVE